MSLFNPYNLIPVGDPAFEAVSIAELKDHARIYSSADDSYLDLLRVAAREQVEKDLNIAVVQQQYNWILPHGFFHHAAIPFSSFGAGYGSYGSYFFDVGYFSLNHYLHTRIPILPVQAINSITYTDTDGNPQTLSTTVYAAKLYQDPPAIWWTGALPSIQPASDIVINLTAGYASSSQNFGIATVTIINGGATYTDGVYTVTVTGGPGTGGTVKLIVAGGIIVDASVLTPGTGYTDQSDFSKTAFDLSGITHGIGTAADLKYFVSSSVVEQPINGVPQLIKAAVKFLATSWYEQRVPVSETLVRAVPLSYERVINLLRVKRF